MRELTIPVEEEAAEASELGRTMSHLLHSPLAALRATMESLAAEFPEGDSRGIRLEAALQQVARLARDIEALVDYAAPRPLQPLRCTAEEILQAAMRPLSARDRERLRIARPKGGETLVVDGPLLAGSLAHLLEKALDLAPETVLVHVRREERATLFALVQPTPCPARSRFPLRPRAAALDLGVALARREIERMGGTFTIQRTARGYTRALVCVPDHGTGEKGPR